MGHHRNLDPRQGGDHFRLIRTAFEFDGLSTRFFEYAARTADRVFGGGVEGHERQIDDHQSGTDRAANHLGVINHLVERDRQRRRASLDDHGKAVAHENRIDPGFVEQARPQMVVGRQHRERFRTSLGRLEQGDGHHGASRRGASLWGSPRGATGGCWRGGHGTQSSGREVGGNTELTWPCRGREVS